MSQITEQILITRASENVPGRIPAISNAARVDTPGPKQASQGIVSSDRARTRQSSLHNTVSDGAVDRCGRASMRYQVVQSPLIVPFRYSCLRYTVDLT